MLYEMPDPLSRKIQDFLRPVEGFRIKENDLYKNNKYIIKIYSISQHTEIIIHGARIFEGDDETKQTEEEAKNWAYNGGWGNKFIITLPKPKNKFCDMVYPYVNNKGECFEGIEINKLNIIKNGFKEL